jgi:hypothetical protein
MYSCTATQSAPTESMTQPKFFFCCPGSCVFPSPPSGPASALTHCLLLPQPCHPPHVAQRVEYIPEPSEMHNRCPCCATPHVQVGLRHALHLAAQHQLPVVPVHHMEAHALTARLPSLGLQPPMTFPALVLLASGGHNMLVLCEGIGRHRIIGTTLDDSAGECFDKIARLLGITAIPGRLSGMLHGVMLRSQSHAITNL